MRPMTVPVTLGSPWFRSLDTSLARVTEARFSAGDVLRSHAHDRPIFAVMLRGSFDTAIARRRLDCAPASAWTEPAEERHANFVGKAGAHVVVFQPDPGHSLFASLSPILSRVVHLNDPLISTDARRAVAELDRDDPLSGLAIDALLLGMLVRAGRVDRPGRERQPPAWLGPLCERLRESFRAPPQLADLAADAGISPARMCHLFRRHMGTTIGEYVRTARASWAAERLRTTSEPLLSIAMAAGYFDQSHFIRESRRLLGTTPSEYRRGRPPANDVGFSHGSKDVPSGSKT